MTEKYEYFFNNVWHECSRKEYLNLSIKFGENYCNLIHKFKQVERTMTSYGDQCDLITECWYIGEYDHRLDGPSHLAKSVSEQKEEVIFGLWYVNGIELTNFQGYHIETNLVENLFLYIRNHPTYIKEVELLARHNKWLTEEQITLLSAQLFF